MHLPPLSTLRSAARWTRTTNGAPTEFAEAPQVAPIRRVPRTASTCVRRSTFRQACRRSSANPRSSAAAARAQRRAGVGSHSGARTGRSERSVTYFSATRIDSAMALARSLSSTPSTERPGACRVSLRHSVSRSTSPASHHFSQCDIDSSLASAPIACGRQCRLPDAGAPPSRELCPQLAARPPKRAVATALDTPPKTRTVDNSPTDKGVSHDQADSFPLHETQWGTAKKDLQITAAGTPRP
jgi:hypothetical protein